MAQTLPEIRSLNVKSFGRMDSCLDFFRKYHTKYRLARIFPMAYYKITINVNSALEHYTSVFYNLAHAIIFIDYTHIFISEIVFVIIPENVIFSFNGMTAYSKS